MIDLIYNSIKDSLKIKNKEGFSSTDDNNNDNDSQNQNNNSNQIQPIKRTIPLEAELGLYTTLILISTALLIVLDHN